MHHRLFYRLLFAVVDPLQTEGPRIQMGKLPIYPQLPSDGRRHRIEYFCNPVFLQHRVQGGPPRWVV